MKPGLLDVNVLIALIDPAHEFHLAAHHWFKRNRHHGWATCPITENGCLRIMSKPGYPFPGLTLNRVREILMELIKVDGHRFWPDSVSILAPDCFDTTHAPSSHLTDLYLLHLAVASGGCLVTFDQRIPWSAVTAATPENLVLLTSR